MNKIVEDMLNSLHPESNEEKKNALKEVIQEIALEKFAEKTGLPAINFEGIDNLEKYDRAVA